MKGETQKSFTPVPWDNMPRQPEPKSHPPQASRKRSPPRGTADPTFSSGHAFHPFQATFVKLEEEK